MTMIPVSSSAISYIGYDSATMKMKITFKQSKTYDYCNVPQNVFDDFLNASSQGIYYDLHIKDKYNCW
ncbi:hypothetical protein YH65_04260 [Sulfurovum lithotrophicum]|uniref:KTSC domain-containing protein n=1 Tax=Sulfurovum lithotrophicum TaxID=206403 RepID=A0A7U4M0R4_9BACT|nr:KTSC domain-containing protein [Sulfurovum lithotrophicum]AKF24687.1 hypothetical protein YH65_04260 [Sulfurovum lithotrophicum]